MSENEERAGVPRRRLALFPLWQTLRNYTWKKAVADGRAAINVALLDFPKAWPTR